MGVKYSPINWDFQRAHTAQQFLKNKLPHGYFTEMWNNKMELIIQREYTSKMLTISSSSIYYYYYFQYE